MAVCNEMSSDSLIGFWLRRDRLNGLRMENRVGILKSFQSFIAFKGVQMAESNHFAYITGTTSDPAGHLAEFQYTTEHPHLTHEQEVFD